MQSQEFLIPKIVKDSSQKQYHDAITYVSAEFQELLGSVKGTCKIELRKHNLD